MFLKQGMTTENNIENLSGIIYASSSQRRLSLFVKFIQICLFI